MKLLYFAPVPWDSYEQRPHYFARHFLDRGGKSVLWVDPYPTRLPSARDLRRLTAGALEPLARPPGLDVAKVTALPLEPTAPGRWLNRQLNWPAAMARFSAYTGQDPFILGIGRPSDLSRIALNGLKPAWSFYDAMDDFPEFYHGRARIMQSRLQQDIVRRVRTVYASSTPLAAKLEQGGARPITVTNAFDMSALPPVAERARAGAIGYAGCIGAWFDWPLVIDLARAVPEIDVRLIGPVAAAPPSPLPPNVAMKPMCPQSEAIAQMASLDAGLIPFALNRLTDGVDPIKYYAYRGLGLPVISTAFGEMTGRGGEPGTFLIGRSSPLAEIVREALTRRMNVDDVTRFRRDNDWNRRFQSAKLFEPAGLHG